jgi:TetR/AcrR family transcriptional regulator, cholesterol catabolism regulator
VPTRSKAEVPPRTAILEAATTLFARHGYTGTSVRDIAKIVGILPGSLYAHIHSKDELLVEIVESGIDRFLFRAAPLLEDVETPADQLLTMAITRHLEVVAEDQQRTLVVFHQWRYLSDTNRRRVVNKRHRYEDVFVQILEAGVNDGTFRANLDQRVVIRSLLGTLNWTAEWLSDGGRDDPVAVGATIAEMTLHGLST